MKHPLKFVRERGLLAEALGITRDDPMAALIEAIVQSHIASGKNMRQLFERVGQLDISEELWANFLYTYGYWDGQRQ
jgi:hypothetical protein